MRLRIDKAGGISIRILIVNPPFYRLQNASLVHYPPSCCYIAASLESAGVDSTIYNADYDPRRKTILGNTNHINVKALTGQAEEYARRLNDESDSVWGEIRDYLVNYQADILIISVFSTTLTAGNRIARMAKEINPKIVTIFEGSTNRGLHCAVDPSTNSELSAMDFAIRKEPEGTAAELVTALMNKVDDFSHIGGLSWKAKEGELVHNPDRAYIRDLDQLPFPARHRLDGYKKMPPHAFQGIYGSRGCPYDCIFCGCHTSWGYKPRLRSAKNMVDEMEHVYHKYGTRYFYVCDDIFFINKKRAEDFCKLLLHKRLPIYWSAQTRAEMIDDLTLELMKKSGGQHIAVGVEVGNENVRNLIKKGNTVDEVRRAAKLIRKHGLYMVAFVMIGLPWEGREEIEDTVNLIREIDPYIVYPYMPTPAAGTELANIVVEKNPGGLTDFRDRCHIDTSSVITERLAPEEKEKIIEKAMLELSRINKKSLISDLFKRPGFYWALAHDMGFFKNPVFFFSYLKDYASV